ncbi:RNA 3'-terminal phosphate cyclase domain-containing protein [Achaetomium macrosporum]|uniref:RNA 3'-terminal phosphate cyclase domain-containing protein n=1 Tax=Achaetomium macrosporum TaxID=79813 RepID=A0AAN7CCX3_9PEZI|nr:RNA 3'-terminal phosphate cyclase domain-containing protein [Achaetomium macrosporum]
MTNQTRVVELDGRTGEGGGQLVRIACALAAVATVPIRITNVRGNREGSRGGGLKSQHVSAIEYLAAATAAEVDGLFIGSHTLEFSPRLRPSQLQERTIKISANSPAASTLLIFQAVFPFLLFAGNDKCEPITLQISGGTNVSLSLSFEYLDQVLLPVLQDAFGITVQRKLLSRGWSLGKQQRGTVEFRFRPLKPGETIKLRDSSVYAGGEPLPTMGDIEEIDVSMIVPAEMHDKLRDELDVELGKLFYGVEVNYKVVEDSGADSRIYVLLVAKAGTVRWGKDMLTSAPKAKSKGGSRPTVALCASLAPKIARELYKEVSAGGVVDEFLQDQLVIFQALAEGRTSFPRGEDKSSLERAMEKLEIDGEKLRKEKTDRPIGEGSMHTTTARWVTAQLLPSVGWYNKGYVCEGVGMHMGRAE